MDTGAWIAPYNIIVMTIFIFLLGVPAFVLQTLIPKDYRVIFNNRIGHQRYYTLLLTGLSILIFYVTLGNYYLYELCTDTLNKPSFNLGWKLMATVYLIWLFSYSCLSLMDSISFFSNKSDYNINVITKLSKIINISLRNHLKKGEFNHQDYYDLSVLSTSKLDSSSFYNHVEETIKSIRTSFENDSCEINDRIKLLELLDLCIDRKENHKEKRVSYVYFILQDEVLLDIDKNKLKLCENKISDLILKIGEIGVKLNSKNLFSKSIDYFISKQNGQSWLHSKHIFTLSKLAINSKNHSMIHKVLSKIKKSKVNIYELSLISYFSQINDIYLKKALSIAKIKNLDATSFEDECRLNYESGQLETVGKIVKFGQDYLGKHITLKY